MSTKKEVKEYTQALIEDLKGVRSMRVQSPEGYAYFKELLKGHPENPEKTSKMTDLKIVRNKLGKGYTLVMVNKDGTEEDISWNKCIYGREIKNVLMEAMRVGIEGQIKEFRETTEKVCTICKRDIRFEESHVDHENYFECIAKTFLKGEKEIPKTFVQNDKLQKRFLEEDKEFEERWAKYHKETAKLRLTCRPCNLHRPHWDGKEPV